LIALKKYECKAFTSQHVKCVCNEFSNKEILLSSLPSSIKSTLTKPQATRKGAVRSS